ncbi:MAG: hypothetical protein GYA56_14880 [Geobacteraceae bacterium]|nr:hypothetical protein [Geobacteraceae bacterium]
MKKGPGVDLYREFIHVFRTEEMLAFFDFRDETTTDGSLSGLCKISRPKPGKAGSRYLSLLFIVETPDEKALQEAEARFGSIDWNGLRNRFPEFESALSIPFTLREFTGNYFQEVDIYLKDNAVVSRSFIVGTLCPSVFSVAGITADEPVFREDLPDARQDLTESLLVDKGSGDSLVSRLRTFFKL